MNLQKYNAEEEKLTQPIKEIFKNIRRIMKENGLVSTYTLKQYKVHKQTCNNDKIDNKLKRNFNQEERMKVI